MTAPERRPDPDGARRGLQSVHTAVEVLQALVRGRGPMTLGEVAEASGLSASKAHRYLASFTAKGLVVQHGRSGAYALGRLAVDIGLAALGRMSLVNAAADGLPELSAKTGATALLSVWGPDGATIVRIERSERLVATALSLGARLPLLNSATGHVFLAHLPERVAAAELRREARTAPVGRERPEAIRARVRAAGFASVDGQFIPGLAAIAAPVLDAQGWPEAAVSLIATDASLTDASGAAVAALTDFARAVGTAPCG
ncbi:MAG: IclR family transcriptional regulator [Alphaproteobacteria bacterium]|nr:IclR family transcriptional regulator [Alphaproteobacteria bacterium]